MECPDGDSFKKSAEGNHDAFARVEPDCWVIYADTSSVEPSGTRQFHVCQTQLLPLYVVLETKKRTTIENDAHATPSSVCCGCTVPK
jgi:hypothetical protein